MEAQEYLKKYRLKTITCPVCKATFEIQKATVLSLYGEFMKLSQNLPDPQSIQGMSNEELAKNPAVLDTLTALLIVGSAKPKVTLARGEDSLGISDLNECCGKFVLQQIIDFSGLSQKADSARMLFAKTEPAKIVGMSSILSGTRPSELIDPERTLTDFEAAALDAQILIEAKKSLSEPGTLDDELQRKYALYDQRLKMWS